MGLVDNINERLGWQGAQQELHRGIDEDVGYTDRVILSKKAAIEVEIALELAKKHRDLRLKLRSDINELFHRRETEDRRYLADTDRTIEALEAVLREMEL